MTSQPPCRPHLLKAPPPLNITTLRTDLPAYNPLEDKPHPNHCTRIILKNQILALSPQKEEISLGLWTGQVLMPSSPTSLAAHNPVGEDRPTVPLNRAETPKGRALPPDFKETRRERGRETRAGCRAGPQRAGVPRQGRRTQGTGIRTGEEWQ